MPEAKSLPDTTALAALAFDLSLRSLVQQEQSLNELRARTGTLVAASSLATSFLGGTAIAHGGFDAWSVLALVAFVASIALATWVLLPKEKLIFSLKGSKVFEEEIEADVFAIGETHRRLAYWIDGFHAGNDTKIDGLFVCYRAATAALLVEIVFWAVQLALS